MRMGCPDHLSSRPPPHQQPGILWILLPPDRLPHFQVGLPAAISRCGDGDWRFGLAGLPVIAARKLSVPLVYGPGHDWGRIAHRVASGVRCECSTMARTRPPGLVMASRPLFYTL